jgi:hypothetical protein
MEGLSNLQKLEVLCAIAQHQSSNEPGNALLLCFVTMLEDVLFRAGRLRLVAAA